jgi:hypothetical protein
MSTDIKSSRSEDLLDQISGSIVEMRARINAILFILSKKQLDGRDLTEEEWVIYNLLTGKPL